MFLIKEWKIISIVVLMFLVIGVGYHFVTLQDGYSSTDVLLKFENIHRGMYPDGISFNKNDLLDDEILTRSIENVDKDLTVSELRGHLEVEGVFPDDIKSRSDEAVDGYNPNEYRLNLYEGELLGLSQEEEFLLLENIVKEFEEKYQVHLSMDYPLPKSYRQNVEEVLQDDYPFVPLVLERQVETLIENAEHLKDIEPNFVSEELDLTFSDITYQLENLKDNNISNIRSIIQKHNLTNDPNKTLNRYESVLQELEHEISEKEERASYARDLLHQIEDGEYSPEGEEQEANIIEDLLRQDYFSETLERSLDEGVEAEALQAEFYYYQDIVTSLEEGDLLEGEEKEEITSDVDNEIEVVLNQMEDYREDIETMRRDMFSQNNDESVEIQDQRERGTSRSIIINLGLFGFIGAFFGVFSAVLKTHSKKFHKVVSVLTKEEGKDNE
ncbi:hypothetical protein [Natranaerobius trueperi]|uniref:Uncharacterized protein n=1 Tax=Natranaerobius trueperi TaxID=759412 RepID=A0A226BWC9_9FIRM|nr:hypothetical protein [Natranaerobius trueperi]OWZ83348.1 hypothetical protein CDO51_09010 [Natranaerobius trueperi]